MTVEVRDPIQPIYTDSLLGHTVGHYVIETRLGGGASATVYRAHDQILGRKVALKVLPTGVDAVTHERFRQEARTVSGLEHPNIVHTLQVGQTDANGLFYIAMELVEGSTLAAVLEQHGRLSVREACLLLAPIAHALAYAHQQGIIHRDVKPSNILFRQVAPGTPQSVQINALGYAVTPLLTDFGVALALDAPDLTGHGRTIGTPAYMAPEQCAGERDLDGRADIYALGGVLYRCLVGRPPFSGTTTQILHAHVYEPLYLPPEVAASWPPALVALLHKALTKVPAQRQRTAAQLATELERVASYAPLPTPVIAPVAQDHTVTLPEVPAVRKTPAALPSVVPTRRAKTHPNWLGLATGTALALLLMLAGIWIITNAFPTRYLNAARIAADRPAQVTSAPLPTPIPALVITATPEATFTTPATRVSLATAETTVAALVTEISTEISTGASPTELPSATPASRPAITSTLHGAPTPAVEVASLWKDIEAFYRERDWNETRQQFILLLRTEKTFNAAVAKSIANADTNTADINADINKDKNQKFNAKLIQEYFFQSPPSEAATAFWSQWQTLFTPAAVKEMLFTSYRGLALANSAPPQLPLAEQWLNEALFLQPDDAELTSLRDAIHTYNTTEGEAQATAHTALLAIQQSYAQKMVEQEDFCLALDQLQGIQSLTAQSATETELQQTDEYKQKCKKWQINQAVLALRKELSGTLIYSTQVGNSYQIYRQPVQPDEPATLLAKDGSQPAVDPAGRVLLFHGTRAENYGINAIHTLGAESEAPALAALRYTTQAEDAKDSPPTWASDGMRFAFASRGEGDRSSRIYLKEITNDRAPTMLLPGEDPAWRPSGDGESWLAFVGRDAGGNNPGLWLVTDDGADRRPLTANEGDRRPAWSRDTRQIVFMRKEDGGNWEVYRLLIGPDKRPEKGSDALRRLTNNPAQDGLPTLSPDGKYVAFVSDRDGTWQIWVRPVEGDAEALPIAPVQGVLFNWLEHALQWTE